ncbi:hypothetical protein BDZ45DRAFT_301773 [Acephala macrosclerotiorum]|nr:hypothetical protein BDZ45DRAFT_301773 [Acephala macrosclerotiorum]
MPLPAVRVPRVSSDHAAAPASLEVKLSTKARNNLEWDTCKDEIERIYVRQHKTLPQTMQEIERRFGFKKSLRSWKSKMKDWGFDKNMTSDMQFMIAKATKRQREGKDTEFSRDGLQVPQETLRNFKRKKIGSATEAVLPAMATPPNITYATPSPISQPGDVPTTPKSPLPSYLDIENSLDVDKEPENQDDIAEISTSTDIQPNPDTGLNSLLKPDQPPLGVASKPLHLSTWGIRAALSMETLFKSLHKSNTPLNGEAFDHHMANVYLFISSKTSDEENISALFQERFRCFVLADEWETLDKGSPRPAMIEEKLEIALKGFFGGNSYSRLDPSQTVSRRLVKSFEDSSQGIKYWKAHLICAKILSGRIYGEEAIDELMESIYELLVLRKPDPRTELMEILHELKRSGFWGMKVFPETIQREISDINIFEWKFEANTTLLYLASALACCRLHENPHVTAEKLVRFIRPHLEVL